MTQKTPNTWFPKSDERKNGKDETSIDLIKFDLIKLICIDEMIKFIENRNL